MKQHYFLKIISFISAIAMLSSCGNDDSPEEYVRVSPVQVDLTTVPYDKLSQYKFFDGEIKNLQPAYKVLPYDLNSSLFTDYAKKKRFVWMPEGQKAAYTADGSVLNFPTGAVLIKNFYYDNVQPGNTTKIIETRLMIKKADGWIFANYVWNDEQTEAFYTEEGSTVNISWNEGGVVKTANYEIPYIQQCAQCHQDNAVRVPIGTKPQNLNKTYNYAEGSNNQLAKWVAEGYLQDNVPGTITSTVDWTDTSKSLDLRARSYIDINCAHCHSAGGECNYTPMRFGFADTTNPANLGICSPLQPGYFIIAGRRINNSDVYLRMNTTNASQQMPQVGRTIVHTEAIQLMKDWINSMENCPE